MFTPEWREKIRGEILQAAKSDARISGGAITGSATISQLDSWSDIDLAFGVQEVAELSNVLDTFTKKIYRDYEAVHHLDVSSGPWIYRVFFLSNTLQVDLAFVPQGQFCAKAPTFKLVFGTCGPNSYGTPAESETYIGWCWLLGLHVRSSIRRGHAWQALYFINEMRDYLISLYCRRHQLPEKEGRGVDQLPREILQNLEKTLTNPSNVDDLSEVFSFLVELCIEEIGLIDKNLQSRIEVTFRSLNSK